MRGRAWSAGRHSSGRFDEIVKFVVWRMSVLLAMDGSRQLLAPRARQHETVQARARTSP